MFAQGVTVAVEPFRGQEIETLSEALEISEDKTGNHFKFSSGQWKRHQYEVKTLRQLNRHEIAPDAFALLHKGAFVADDDAFKTKSRDFYYICLQDNHIRHAVQRDRDISLLSLLVYILTHELVHIVRFCNFNQRFEARAEGRSREERIVHSITYDILKDLSLPRMNHVLNFYANHRTCDVIC